VSRRHVFTSLCALVFLVNFGRVAFAALLKPLQSAFAVSPATIGVVATLVWLGTGLPRIPTGYLLTRIPRRTALIASGGIVVAASLLTASATTVGALMVGALAVGVGSGVYFTTAAPTISELYPGRMGSAIGLHGMASQIAAVTAPSVVLAVLALATWRHVFLLLAAVTTVATVVLASTSATLAVTSADSSADRDFAAAIRSAWPVILAGIAVVGVPGFVWNGLFNFYVSYLTAAKPVSDGTAQLLLTVVFAAGVPAFWLSGRLSDRFPGVTWPFVIITSFIVGVVGLTAATTLPALVVATVVTGYAIHSLFPAIDAYVLGTLPNEHRGSAYSVFTGVSLLIEANGSATVGFLLDAGYPYEAIFHAGAVVMVGLLVGLLTLNATGRLPAPGR
jgi:MFS family permease